MSILNPELYRFRVLDGTAGQANALASSGLASARVKSITLRIDSTSPASGTIETRYALVGTDITTVAPGETVCLNPDHAGIIDVSIVMNGGATGKWIIELWWPL
jgi:hypothetical protein